MRKVTIQCKRNDAPKICTSILSHTQSFEYKGIIFQYAVFETEMEDNTINLFQDAFGDKIIITKEPTIEELLPKVKQLLEDKADDAHLTLDWSVDAIVNSNFSGYDYSIHITDIYVNHTDCDELWIEDSGSYEEPLSSLDKEYQLAVLKEAYEELTNN